MDLHPYTAFFNKKKVKLGKSTTLDINENNNVFYVKTYWFKTKEFKLNTKNNKCTVKVENILKKHIHLLIVGILISLITVSIYTDNDLMWDITLAISILWLIFQISMYTIFRRKYISVNIEYYN